MCVCMCLFPTFDFFGVLTLHLSRSSRVSARILPRLATPSVGKDFYYIFFPSLHYVCGQIYARHYLQIVELSRLIRRKMRLIVSFFVIAVLHACGDD